MKTEINPVAMKEWGKWQLLVALLKQAGAVTEQDCKSPMSVNGTPGQKLFQAVRAWGDLRYRMGYTTAETVQSKSMEGK